MNTQQVTQEDIFKVINTLATQVRNDLMESEVFEDSDTLETIKTIVFLAQLHNSDWSYPFTEGDTYYTIEHDTIIESVWDEESKELYLSDSNKLYNHSDQQYFSSLDHAVHYFRTKGKSTPKLSLL